MQEQRYDPGEYYDLAVMGYLRAVERYCSHAYLRRFSFSTVAYRAMQQSIVSWKRGESRRRQAEEAYLIVIDVDISVPACCITNGGVPDV